MSGVAGRLAGRVAIVTGASQGLGRAIAIRLAEDGAHVVVNHLADSEDEGERVVAGLAGEGIAVRGDVSAPDDVARIAAAALDRFGRIDVLVNNAGIFPWRAWTEIAPDEWDRVLAVNLKGAFLMAQACVPEMARNGWGRVISISSATALTGAPFLMHYAASKAGIVAFTRSLAAAVGDQGITANAVTTGKTLTEGFEAWFEDGTLDRDEAEATRQSQPIKRMAIPEDIVGTVSFLASDDAAFMTGQLLNVDGGRNPL